MSASVCRPVPKKLEKWRFYNFIKIKKPFEKRTSPLSKGKLKKLEFHQYHFAFLYESRIWFGANNIAAISKRIDRLIIPLNKNKTEGITDSASALNMLLFLKQIIQIAQYNTTNIVSTIRYMANASSDHHPNHVPGMLIIIKPKQPSLPICSATSINLLLHLFSKPSLHLIAKIILGIIMTAIIISPNIFNQSICSSTNFQFAFLFILENGQSRLELPTLCTNYAIFSCLHLILHQMM